MAKKTKTPEATATAQTERPFDFVPLGAQKRHVTTEDASVKELLAADEPRPSLPTPGPTTSGGNPASELLRLATPDELREFTALVRKRRGVTDTAWLKCVGGCGYVGKFRADHAGGPCYACNFRGLQKGGHLQTMTPEEVAAYERDKAARDKAVNTRMELAALRARNDERTKAGLPAFTLPQFRAERNAAYRRQIESDRRVAALAERGRT